MVSASLSRYKATFVRAGVMVPLWLESFEGDGIKNLCDDVHLVNVFINRAHGIVSLLGKRKKNRKFSRAVVFMFAMPSLAGRLKRRATFMRRPRGYSVAFRESWANERVSFP